MGLSATIVHVWPYVIDIVALNLLPPSFSATTIYH